MSAEPGMNPERESVFEDFSGFEPEKITIPKSIEKSVADALVVEIDRSRARGPEGEAAARVFEAQLDELIFNSAINSLDKVSRKPVESDGGFEIPIDLEKGQEHVMTQEIPSPIESVGDTRQRKTRDRIKLHAKKWVVNTMIGIMGAFGAFGASKAVEAMHDNEATQASIIKEDAKIFAATQEAKRLADESEVGAKVGGLTMAERVAASAKDVAEIPTEEVAMGGITIKGDKEVIEAGRQHVAGERLATAKKMSEELLTGGKDLDSALEDSTLSAGGTEMASIHDVDRQKAEKPDQLNDETGTAIASDI